MIAARRWQATAAPLPRAWWSVLVGGSPGPAPILAGYPRHALTPITPVVQWAPSLLARIGTITPTPSVLAAYPDPLAATSAAAVDPFAATSRLKGS